MKRQVIKLNRNRSTLSQAEINRLRDFSQVMKGARGGASSWGNRLAYLAGLAIILGIGWLSWSQKPDPSVKNPEPASAGVNILPAKLENKPASAIKPPVAYLDIPFDTFYLDAERGGKFRKGKSSFRIPANSMIDHDGRPVSGMVTILYREFHDPVDFALAGIPMMYDSASTRYMLESAGMCEIRAYRNNEELKLKAGEKIDIHLESRHPGMYNVYQFDDASGNWNYKGANFAEDKRKPEVPVTNITEVKMDGPQNTDTLIPALKKEIITLELEISKIEKEIPAKPVKLNTRRYHFEVWAEAADFPELQEFGKVVFEVTPENKYFTPAYYDVTWNDIRLERYADMKYMMTLCKKPEPQKRERRMKFTKGKRMQEEESVRIQDTIQLIVSPVLDGDNYTKAKARFDEITRNYQDKLQEKQAKEAELKRRLEEQMKLLSDKEDRMRAEWALKNGDETTLRNIRRDNYSMIRSFAADGFGVWNCDNPLLVNAGTFTACLVDENGKELKVISAGTVFSKANGLFPQYITGSCGSITYSASMNQKFFCILDGGKVAQYPKQRFDVRRRNVTLVMEVSEKEFETADQIKAYLRFGR